MIVVYYVHCFWNVAKPKTTNWKLGESAPKTHTHTTDISTHSTKNLDLFKVIYLVPWDSSPFVSTILRRIFFGSLFKPSILIKANQKKKGTSNIFHHNQILPPGIYVPPPFGYLPLGYVIQLSMVLPRNAFCELRHPIFSRLIEDLGPMETWTMFFFLRDKVGVDGIWSNYSDLTRPHPKWWFSKGNPLISGKSRLVKYYNLARWNEDLPSLKTNRSPPGTSMVGSDVFPTKVRPFWGANC